MKVANGQNFTYTATAYFDSFLGLYQDNYTLKLMVMIVTMFLRLMKIVRKDSLLKGVLILVQ